MKILLIGSGGREHALAKLISKSPQCTDLYIAPGNAGTSECGININIPDTAITELRHFAQENSINLTIVGPEGPLSEGIVDDFENHALPIVGPNKQAALVESSKDFSKSIMKKAGVPTAEYQTFTDFESAKSYILTHQTYPIVIKADGLAAGKGVTIAKNEAMALEALSSCFIKNQFKQAGHRVVIESFLSGEEASIFAFVDSTSFQTMPPAQDHKQIYDNDTGPNTGGMGAFCPTPLVDKELISTIETTIIKPFLDKLKEEGITYKGILYTGLMIENGIPSVVEFNARFGDPETQVVLPLLKTDIVDIFSAITTDTLDQINIEWTEESAVCVVLAAEGYPQAYEKNKPITLPTPVHNHQDIIHAGTQINPDTQQLVTNGGRVIGAIGIDNNLQKAIDYAYQMASTIQFNQKYYRNDIAKKAFRHIAPIQ